MINEQVILNKEAFVSEEDQLFLELLITPVNKELRTEWHVEEDDYRESKVA